MSKFKIVESKQFVFVIYWLFTNCGYRCLKINCIQGLDMVKPSESVRKSWKCWKWTWQSESGPDYVFHLNWNQLWWQAVGEERLSHNNKRDKLTGWSYQLWQVMCYKYIVTTEACKAGSHDKYLIWSHWTPPSRD